jgi:membrane-associated PAP2 superfamily phosphatase
MKSQATGINRSSVSVYWLFGFYIIALLILDIGHGDIWIANKLYAIEGHQWALRQHWLTEDILHKGIQKVNYIFCLSVIVLTFYYVRNRKHFPDNAKDYTALTLSLLSSFILVGYLKAVTNIACPWDLTLFGGTQPYIHLFEPKPHHLRYTKCFPAGHASIGYAWVALYFFFEIRAPQWRWIGLGIGLVLGIILGVTQQLRGAHFLSHDITTLMVCLLCAKLCFMFTHKVATSGDITRTT